MSFVLYQQDPVYVVGRITVDAETSAGGKLTESTLALEASRMSGSGARVPLRFDAEKLVIRGAAAGASGVGLFPGAIACFKGRNGSGNWFQVEEILAVSF
jgi:DNA polymerase alpha subunit B